MATSEAHLRAINKYQKANIKGVYFRLSKKYDSDILAKLDSVDNKQGYIKALIRKDIENEQK